MSRPEPAPEARVERPASDRGPPILRSLTVAAGLATFLVLALFELRRPGLYYDEVLFVNAALGGEDDAFVRARVFGVPLAVMSYIGALKSWVHAPVFWLLGVTPDTVRMPSVLLAAVALLALWRLGVRLFGAGLAAVLALVLATDPAFVLQARMDYGPTVLMMVTKAAALVCLVRWLTTSRVRWAWGLSVSLGLGLFDKLNFIWFVLALGGATLLVWPRELLVTFRRTGRAVLPPLIAFLLVLLLAAYQSLRLVLRQNPYDEAAGTAGLIERVPTVLGLWADTATGSGYHRFVFGEPIPAPSWAWIGFCAGLLIFLAARARRPDAAVQAPPALPRPDVFFLVLLGLLFVQMVATPQARGAHHALMAWPFHWLFVFASVERLLRAEYPGGRRQSRVALAILAVLLVGSQFRATVGFVDRLDAPSAYRAVWSPASYRLSDRLTELRSSGPVLSIDWGLHNQLFTLAPPDQRGRYDDLWQRFFDLSRGEATADEIFANHFRGREALAVLFVPEHAGRPSAKEVFLQFAARHLQRLDEPELVRDAAGRALFEIHRVRG